MNIFIADKDNRDLVSLVYHYTKLGHKVFVPKPGTEGFGMHPKWPRLILRASSDPTKRNLDIYGFEDYDSVEFGEDRFLSQEIDEIRDKLYEQDACLELIDINKDSVHIDAWHSTPNSITDLPQWIEFAKKHFPHAKWISSCMTHWDHSLSYNPKNLVKFLPANYKNLRMDINQVEMYRHRIEFDVMNIDYNTPKPREGWASFNHNFAVRHPQFFALQTKLNEDLKGRIVVQNYGGNIRQVGADIKYSGESGITGKDPTISPRQAMKKYTTLRGVLHLKGADWAGGVPSMSRMGKVPIIVTGRYVEDTCAQNVFIHKKNCMVANNYEDLLNYVQKINDDDVLWQELSEGQDRTNDELFNEDYWKRWDEFISRIA